MESQSTENKIKDFRENGKLNLNYLVENYDENEILEMYQYSIENDIDEVSDIIMELGKSEIFKI